MRQAISATTGAVDRGVLPAWFGLGSTWKPKNAGSAEPFGAKEMPQVNLPVYPEVPYAFFGFQLWPSTYSTFGILKFTVLSRLGQAKVSSRSTRSVKGKNKFAARLLFGA
jgi:hypothetical protein